MNPKIFDSFAGEWFGPYAPSTGSYLVSFHFWFNYLSPYFRFMEFIMGVLAAHLFLSMRAAPAGKAERMLMPLAGIISLLMILVFLLPLGVRPERAGNLYKTVGFYPFIACMIFVCARYDSAVLLNSSRYASSSSSAR